MVVFNMRTQFILFLGRIGLVEGKNLNVTHLSLFPPVFYWESGTMFVDDFRINSSFLTIVGGNSESHLIAKHIQVTQLKMKNKIIFELATKDSTYMSLFQRGSLSITVNNSRDHPTFILRGSANISNVTLIVNVIGEILDVRLLFFRANHM